MLGSDSSDDSFPELSVMPSSITGTRVSVAKPYRYTASISQSILTVETTLTKETVIDLCSDPVDDIAAPAYIPSSSVTGSIQKKSLKSSLIYLSESDTELEPSLQDVPKPKKKKTKISEEEKRLRAEEKAKAKAAKEEQKRLAKEEKQAEQERQKGIRTANKLLSDKNECVQELIIELDSRLTDKIIEELVACFQQFKVETAIKTHQIPGTILIKRKATRTWLESSQCFVPCAPYKFDEKFVIKVMDADRLAQSVSTNSLENHVKSTQAAHQNKLVLYLITGMTRYYYKRKQLQNKQFKDGIVTPLDLPDKEQISRALLSLQCKKLCHVIVLDRDETISEWMITYAKTISWGAYQKFNKAKQVLQFSVEDMGPSGKTPAETWERMLEQVSGITPAVSKAIVRHFPTFLSLYKELKLYGSSRIEHICLTRENSNRRLGRALAEKLRSIFTSKEGHLKVKDI